MSSNASIHDNFIRAILADKNMAADYFCNYLPPFICQQLDFSTLTQLPDTYLSEELQKTMSDIVYTCRKNNGTQAIKVSLLVEHKSYPDKYTPVQIGSYIFSALQKQVANKEQLSIIIPVLLYHGKGGWQYQTLASLFETLEPEWEQFLPDFAYIYNNLGEIPDEQVEALHNKFLAASLLVLKHSFQKNWLKHNALRMLILAENAPESLQKSFIIYLLYRSGLNEAGIAALLESLPVTLKKTVMSTADVLIEKGRREGIEKGREEGMEKKGYEVVKNLLTADKFTIAEIANFANVQEDFVREIKKNHNNDNS
jgi:predicted transposase/invertase (TIGR01784 family)